MPSLAICTLDVFSQLNWVYGTNGDPMHGWPTIMHIKLAFNAPLHASISTISGTPMSNEKYTLYNYNMCYAPSQMVITWNILPTKNVICANNQLLNDLLGHAKTNINMVNILISKASVENEIAILIKRLGLNGVYY